MFDIRLALKQMFLKILKNNSYVFIRVNNGEDKNNVNNHNLMSIYYWPEIVLRFLCKLCRMTVTETLGSIHFSSFYGCEN